MTESIAAIATLFGLDPTLVTSIVTILAGFGLELSGIGIAVILVIAMYIKFGQ